METETFIFKKVMIIDDTKIDRYIASHTMKKTNFAREIIEFDLAKKAIVYLEENQHLPEALPEIIILDVRMPEMDGFQFLERLSLLPQSLKQSCCIVMLSSSLDPADHDRAERNPVVKKFMNKPLSKANLEEIKKLYSDFHQTEKVSV
ncbi:MAG: response regulator [Bacteroidota bacterium]